MARNRLPLTTRRKRKKRKRSNSSRRPSKPTSGVPEGMCFMLGDNRNKSHEGLRSPGRSALQILASRDVDRVRCPDRLGIDLAASIVACVGHIARYDLGA